jgi:hypothetical protein
MTDEELQFLRRFLLASGSLKAIAEEYNVSYPTVRARLDRLIEKVAAIEDPKPRDALERALRVLVAEGSLSPSVAKHLLRAHRDSVAKAGNP